CGVSPRLYYALGTYGGLRGEDPYFTAPPDDPNQIPCIQIAQDFTGRTLDRTRFGRRDPTDARYGAPATPLTWGGDAAVRGKQADQSAAPPRSQSAEPEYDDGYDKSLWTRPLAAQNGGRTGPPPGGAGLKPRAERIYSDAACAAH